jgi:hypothetical protein
LTSVQSLMTGEMNRCPLSSTCVIPYRAERNADVLSAVDTSWTVRRSDSTLKIVGQRNRLLWDNMMAAKRDTRGN